jgi:hypothetical protein
LRCQRFDLIGVQEDCRESGYDAVSDNTLTRVIDRLGAKS